VCCLNTKGCCIGTPYHPCSTPWKIQVCNIHNLYIFTYIYVNKNCFESFWKEWSGIQPWQKIIEKNTSDGTYKHVDLLVSARCVVGICVHLFHRRFSFQHHVPNATILRTWSQFWENEFTVNGSLPAIFFR